MPKRLSKELPVDRKYELMIRDDEFNNYIAKSREWLKNPNNEDLTKEVDQLKKQQRDKWNARIHWPESTIQGVTDFWMLVREPYKAVEDGRNVGGTMIFEDGLNLNKMIFASFEKNGLIHCPSYKIPIIIDPTILTLNDSQTVKQAVWDIVKAEIGKEKKTIKGRDFAIPPKEPEELAAIFRCRPEKFAKYLRWYDLKKAGLSFRMIALIEFHTKNAEDKESKFKQYAGMKRKPRIGLPVKGESTVRGGFGIIYQAIFRTSAPTQEDLIATLETYNCPQHGQTCDDPDCDYLKQWLTDFESKYKEKSLVEQLNPFNPSI